VSYTGNQDTNQFTVPDKIKTFFPTWSDDQWSAYAQANPQKWQEFVGAYSGDEFEQNWNKYVQSGATTENPLLSIPTEFSGQTMDSTMKSFVHQRDADLKRKSQSSLDKLKTTLIDTNQKFIDENKASFYKHYQDKDWDPTGESWYDEDEAAGYGWDGSWGEGGGEGGGYDESDYYDDDGGDLGGGYIEGDLDNVDIDDDINGSGSLLNAATIDSDPAKSTDGEYWDWEEDDQERELDEFYSLSPTLRAQQIEENKRRGMEEYEAQNKPNKAFGTFGSALQDYGKGLMGNTFKYDLF
jgi:hypothetical protein